jgi:hypothetical protein
MLWCLSVELLRDEEPHATQNGRAAFEHDQTTVDQSSSACYGYISPALATIVIQATKQSSNQTRGRLICHNSEK